jgi:hypothetical protein
LWGVDGERNRVLGFGVFVGFRVLYGISEVLCRFLRDSAILNELKKKGPISSCARPIDGPIRHREKLMSPDRQKGTAAGRQIRGRRRIAGPASRGKWARLDFFNGRQKQIISIYLQLKRGKCYRLIAKLIAPLRTNPPPQC